MKARTSQTQDREERHCDGTCKQGEGDCDWDSECLPGLKCKFDWGFGTDYCVAGEMLVASLRAPHFLFMLQCCIGNQGPDSGVINLLL